jgi:hypothetical protein
LQYQPEHQLQPKSIREIISPFSKYFPSKKHQPIDLGVEGGKALLRVGVLGLEVDGRISLEGSGVVDVLGLDRISVVIRGGGLLEGTVWVMVPQLKSFHGIT